MLAELLLSTLERFGEAGELLVTDIGRDFGRRLAAETPAGGSVAQRLAPLTGIGAELEVDVQGEQVIIRTGNCLFREVATRKPRLVCLLDRAIIGGMLSSDGASFAFREHRRRTDGDDVCTLVFDAVETYGDESRSSEVGKMGTTSAQRREGHRDERSTSAADVEAAGAEDAEDQG